MMEILSVIPWLEITTVSLVLIAILQQLQLDNLHERIDNANKRINLSEDKSDILDRKIDILDMSIDELAEITNVTRYK